MDVRVMQKRLSPGVENREEAKRCSEVLGIGGSFEERFGSCAKKDRIDDFLVAQCERGDLRGHCEHDVVVGDGEQFGGARGEPLRALVSKTRWAMAIAARVVGRALRAAF